MMAKAAAASENYHSDAIKVTETEMQAEIYGQ